MVDWDESDGGRPNVIALKFGPGQKTIEKKVKDKEKGTFTELKIKVDWRERYTITDDLDGVSELVKLSIAQNAPVYTAPVSWFGKRNIAANARFLHAFTVDLDGVSLEKAANLLKQIENGSDPENPKWVTLPVPTFIVNSGTGFHLYYVLDNPIPLVPSVVPFLQDLKRRLIDVVWTDYTSEYGNDGRQYQGIYQSFRMPGTTTKLNGKGELSKTDMKYEAVAFALTGKGEGEPHCVSIDYLVDYCGIRGRDIPDELREVLRAKGGKTPIERARKLWPEWYKRRIVDGMPAGHWECKRDLYDWWLRTIEEQAKEGGRYYAVLGLVAYGRKCGIDYSEVEADAYSLIERFDNLTTQPGNHFTSHDVMCAMDAYGDDRLLRYTRDFISRKTFIPMQASKRNGRKLRQHIDIVNETRRMRRDMYGEDEYANSGRPSKRDLVLDYAAEHPEASHSAIAKELGVSRTTVIKWLKDAQMKAEGTPSIDEMLRNLVK